MHLFVATAAAENKRQSSSRSALDSNQKGAS